MRPDLSARIFDSPVISHSIRWLIDSTARMMRCCLWGVMLAPAPPKRGLRRRRTSMNTTVPASMRALR